MRTKHRRSVPLRHEFVDLIPEGRDLKEGILYVSISYATTIHRCCCGCGTEVVAPLSPTDWQLIFDGESVTLDPSIGNWSFPCRSHYWIRKDRAEWALPMSQREIEAGRQRDQIAKGKYYSGLRPADGHNRERVHSKPTIWRNIAKLFSRKSRR
jgi:Family of unknown function (DUF6527)